MILRSLILIFTFPLLLSGCGDWSSSPSAVSLPIDYDSSVTRLKRDVRYLSSPDLKGRRTGEDGERAATRYAAKELRKVGFSPAGDDDTFFQEFEFTSGFALGKRNSLTVSGGQTDVSYAVESDWIPLSFSASGEFLAAPLVFAGYGIRLEDSNGDVLYDSYAHLDVKDKWVVLFRFSPEDAPEKIRDRLKGLASFRHKATLARDLGARGVIFIAAPGAKVREELLQLSGDATLAGTSIPVIISERQIVEKALEGSGKDLVQVEKALSAGTFYQGFAIPGVTLAATIEIERVRRKGRSTIAKLALSDGLNGAIVIGAHIDHLGVGRGSDSLARDDEAHDIHLGADDNASGVAAALEIGRQIARQAATGAKFKRDLIVALWSGEELGLLGSGHFVRELNKPEDAQRKYAAYINMDMVGRLRSELIVQGIGSSDRWEREVNAANDRVKLPIISQNDSYLPTDSTSFYVKGVPVLSAFTGSHEEYHTPRDKEHLVNYPGLGQVTEFLTKVTEGLLDDSDPIPYRELKRPEHFGMRANMRAYLGTIPDYGAADVQGVRLAGVAKGGPADEGGVRGGDIIVRVGKKKVENIYDYTFAIEGIKVGEKIQIEVMREGKKQSLTVIPRSRQ